MAAIRFRFVLTARLWLRTHGRIISPHLANKGLLGNWAATLCYIHGKILLEVRGVGVTSSIKLPRVLAFVMEMELMPSIVSTYDKRW